MRNRFIAAALGGAAVSVLAAGIVTGVVSARPNEQQPPSPTATATPNARQQQAQQRADEFIERLARNLGVTTDRLRDALKQTALEEIDRAQAEGRLTPEQAARARERINAGNLGGFGFGFGVGPGGKHGMGLGIGRIAHEELAQFLGITPEQLRTELPGKSLAQVAQAHGKTVDQLKNFIIQNTQQELAQAVQQGRITQQQADQALQRLRERIDDIVNRVHGTRMGPRQGR
jgi:carboxylesterase type B